MPQIFVALFRACKGDPSPLRVFDGHRTTKEDAADRGTIERGKRSGRIYIFAGIPIFAAGVAARSSVRQFAHERFPIFF